MVLERAATLARETGAPLIVLHVMASASENEMVTIPASEPIERNDAKAVCQRRLHEAVSRIAALPALATETVRIGTPADEILRAAQEAHSGLVVLGVHHDGSLGNTIGEVVRRARCPVLTVPSA